MKNKTLIIFIILIGMIILTGCGAKEKVENTNDNQNEVIENTATETKTEEKEKTQTVAKIWEKRYYVDDFDIPTDEWYIANADVFSGTFSNSATTDSKLYAYILVDESDVSIILYEYGRNQVKNSSSRYDEDYDIMIRLDDDTRTEIKGAIYPGNDRITIDSKYKSKVIDALKNSKNVMFRITQSDRTTTTYLFTADCANFKDVYEN